MRLELLAHFEGQAGHGVVVDIRGNGLQLVGDLLLHLVLLARDVAGVLHLDFDLFGQDLIRSHAGAGEERTIAIANGHQGFIGNIRAFQQIC
ncbi:hypothetical protein D3C71_1316750 [compost metagenome]